jgi:hypothetical protein
VSYRDKLRALAGSTRFDDILDYIGSPRGLNQTISPVQTVILKLFYAIPLDAVEPSIEVRDMFNETVLHEFTEAQYVEYLYKEGRCSVKKSPKKPFNEMVWSGGRRGRKTTTAATVASYELVKLLEHHDPQKYYGIIRNAEIRISNVASSSAQSKLYYDALASFLEQVEYFKPYTEDILETYTNFFTPSQLDKKKAKKKVRHGSLKLTSAPCSARTSRGPNNIIVIFDELAHFMEALKTSGSDKSDEAIYNAITPSTAGFKNDGKIISISSPWVKSGKFFELTEQALAPDMDDILYINTTCYETNPLLSPDYLKGRFKKNPDNYYIEYLARWAERHSPFVKKPEDLRKLFVPGYTPEKRFSFYYGMDIGLLPRTGDRAGDGTGISITYVDNGIIRHAHTHRIVAGEGDYVDTSVLKLSQIGAEIRDLNKKFPCAAGMFDQWNGFGMEEELIRRGINRFKMVNFDRKLNSQIYELVLKLMWQEALEISDPDLLEEMLLLNSEQLKNGLIKVEAPPGIHDDDSDGYARSVFCAYSHGILKQEVGLTQEQFTQQKARLEYTQSILYGSKRFKPRGKTNF